MILGHNGHKFHNLTWQDLTPHDEIYFNDESGTRLSFLQKLFLKKAFLKLFPRIESQDRVFDMRSHFY